MIESRQCNGRERTLQSSTLMKTQLQGFLSDKAEYPLYSQGHDLAIDPFSSPSLSFCSSPICQPKSLQCFLN